MSHFWDMGTAWKKGANIFRLFLNFQQHPFDIDFSTISSSCDMNNMFLADRVTFLNRP